MVIAGPGGVGKSTVVAALRDRLPDVSVSVSATTRPRRPDERDGVDYHFLTDERFDALDEAGGFLEWVEFNGRRYGTPWSSVEQAAETASTVILEIDAQGAYRVRERFPSATLVFLRPPSDEALLTRLRRRGSEAPEEIARRMAIARWELDQAAEFDHVVVNDLLDETVEEIARILER